MTPREYDQTHGFSIVPPAGWQDYVSRDESFMAYRAPAKLTEASRFAAYFRVSELKDLRVDILDLGEHLKPFFDQMMGKWKLSGEGFEVISGQKSYFIGVKQDPVKCGCHDLQYYVPGKGGVYFLITFSAPATDYKQFEPIFRDVARSIQLL